MATIVPPLFEMRLTNAVPRVSRPHNPIQSNPMTTEWNTHSQNGPAQSTRIGEGSILTLERIERHQAGIYQCTADNGVGEPVVMEMKLDILCKYPI